jgi:hypothetical protein
MSNKSTQWFNISKNKWVIYLQIIITIFNKYEPIVQKKLGYFNADCDKRNGKWKTEGEFLNF